MYQMQILPSKLPNRGTAQLVYLIFKLSLYSEYEIKMTQNIFATYQ